jgi:NTE family protein
VASTGAFCRLSIDSAAIGEGIFSPFKTVGDAVEKRYAGHLFGKATLADLPDRPRFIFNATNLQTGRSFRLSKPYMGDYRIGLRRNPTVTVARAVAASSAFPPVLSPVTLDKPGPFEAVEGADLAGKPAYTRRIFRTDGGVDDNLGLETVWNRCRTVLVSDAGAPFSIDADAGGNLFSRLKRSNEVIDRQSRALRKRMLIQAFERGDYGGSYWGIGTAIGDYPLTPKAAGYEGETLAKIAGIRTDLDEFKPGEQAVLMNHGWLLSGAAMRAHCPEWPDRPSEAPDETLLVNSAALSALRE